MFILILVVVLITGRADAVTERTQRDGDLVSVGDQIRAHAALNLNTEAQLRAEIGKGGADIDQSFQNPNDFSYSESLESGESFETETNAVTGYDGEDQFNGANSLIIENIKNTFKENTILGSPSNLLNKPGQEPEYLYVGFPNTVPSSNPTYAYGDPFAGTIPQVDRDTYPSISYNGPVHKYTPSYQQSLPVSDTGIEKNTLMANGYEATRNPNWISYQKGYPNKSLVPPDVVSRNVNNNHQNWNPYTKPAEGETLVQAEQEIQSSGKAEVEVTAQEINNRSPNRITYQKGNPNKSLVPPDVVSRNVNNNNQNWNPYTKPAEGETLVQAEQEIQSSGKAEAEATAQEINNRSPNRISYQKENPNKSLMPSNIVSPKYSNNNKHWNPYTKPVEGESLAQLEGEIQSSGKAEAEIATQENGNLSPNWIPYQKGNPNKSLVPPDVVSRNVNNNNQNWNPYTKPADGETLVQAEQEIQSSGKAKAEATAQEINNRSPNRIPYQKGNAKKSFVPIDVVSPNGYNNNQNWNPYTKPAEGETLVQVEGDVHSSGKGEADTTPQEINYRGPNWISYQKGNPNKSIVPTDVISPSGYNNNNKNWNPNTKPAEGETLVQEEGEIQSSQLNSGSQHEPSTQANIEAYSSGGFQYSGEDKITSVAKTDTEAQINIASIHSGVSPYNWEAQGLAAAQTSEDQYVGAQNSESSLYVNTNKYNHLKNGAQFGASVGAETVVQAGPVLESRFFQTSHPPRRPLPAFGNRQSRNGWNHW